MSLACSYGHVCSGCELLNLPRSQVETMRLQRLEQLDIHAADIETIWIQDGGLRNHLEFTFVPASDNNSARLGLYEKFKPSRTRNIVDLAGCPQLTPDLESWLQSFRRDLPPLTQKSSIRLRVAPDGKRGVWIDTANEEIRDLLFERQWVTRQLGQGIVVEIGQRKKRVVNEAVVEAVDSVEAVGRLRLVDPVLESWFQTIDGHKLFGTVASFTQPGWRAASKLTEAMLNSMPASASLVLEFGAGCGGFTLPLLSRGHRVNAFEFDSLALSGLKMAMQQLPEKNRTNLQLFEGDFIQSDRAWKAAQPRLELSQTEFVKAIALVDPPRSGLGKFLETLLETPANLPEKWIYVSCYPESFARDLARLRERGYQLDKLTIVEQFPYTNHFEIVASIVVKPKR